MLESLVITFGTISTAVTFVVTFIKSLLLQIPAFENADAQVQAIVLQLVAFIAGIVIAISMQANFLTAFPQFADIPQIAGYALTGLACGGGSQLFYVILALLSGKVLLPPASQAVTVNEREDYVPFS